jgi:hypothetical protein
MITMIDVEALVGDLKKKESTVYKFIDSQHDFIPNTTRSMLLSDADLFKRYAEMASDISEEDLQYQDRMKEFIEITNKAIEATLYNKKIKPVENAL